MNPLCDLYLQADGEELNTALIIELLQEDISNLASLSKGKGRQGQMSDLDLALELFKQDLEANVTSLTDHRMARSLANAIQSDWNVLNDALIKENMFNQDRLLARSLNSGTVSPTPDQEKASSIGVDIENETINKLSALYMYGPEGMTDFSFTADGGSAEASTSGAASKKSANATCDRRCEACQDDKKWYDLARTPCGHEYCRDCLEDLFRSSLTDESLFPPRCCREPINIKLVRPFLKAELVNDYEKKRIEYGTVNRIYCHRPTCSAFIGIENIDGNVAKCSECQLSTCTDCRGAAHTGDCPNDDVLQQVLEVARQNSWQRCYSCWRLVELDYGCNHMS